MLDPQEFTITNTNYLLSLSELLKKKIKPYITNINLVKMFSSTKTVSTISKTLVN